MLPCTCFSASCSDCCKWNSTTLASLDSYANPSRVRYVVLTSRVSAGDAFNTGTVRVVIGFNFALILSFSAFRFLNSWNKRVKLFWLHMISVVEPGFGADFTVLPPPQSSSYRWSAVDNFSDKPNCVTKVPRPLHARITCRAWWCCRLLTRSCMTLMSQGCLSGWKVTAVDARCSNSASRLNWFRSNECTKKLCSWKWCYNACHYLPVSATHSRADQPSDVCNVWHFTGTGYTPSIQS